MGQSLSGPIGTQESHNPKYLINLYSREFHEDVEPIDGMYLNDYGDDDIPPSDCSHLVDIATPPVNVDDKEWEVQVFVLSNNWMKFQNGIAEVVFKD